MISKYVPKALKLKQLEIQNLLHNKFKISTEMTGKSNKPTASRNSKPTRKGATQLANKKRRKPVVKRNSNKPSKASTIRKARKQIDDARDKIEAMHEKLGIIDAQPLREGIHSNSVEPSTPPMTMDDQQEAQLNREKEFYKRLRPLIDGMLRTCLWIKELAADVDPESDLAVLIDQLSAIPENEPQYTLPDAGRHLFLAEATHWPTSGHLAAGPGSAIPWVTVRSRHRLETLGLFFSLIKDMAPALGKVLGSSQDQVNEIARNVDAIATEQERRWQVHAAEQTRLDTARREEREATRKQELEQRREEKALKTPGIAELRKEIAQLREEVQRLQNGSAK